MDARQHNPKTFVVARDNGPAIAQLRGAVIAIGNFDGVHRGHRTVIDTAMRRAATLGARTAALTLDPHPRRFLRPQEPLFMLTSLEQKLRLLAATGLDGAVVLTFDAALAGLPAEDFVARILVERLAVRGVAVGFDFHFGKGRGGSPEFLVAQGHKYGFPVDIVAPLEDEGRPVSSRTIRQALAAGRVVEAAELLGFPWFVSGTVIHGDKRGRDLGYPTANIRLDPSCELKHGIYAVRATVAGKVYEGVASFGRRPTFDNGAPLLEVFLFDFSGDLYGQTLDISFIAWLRPELRFDDIDALVRQMNEDSRRAREVLVRTAGTFSPPP
jgi:riboflavin kinase/FMN adenylyltransferase